MQSMVAAQMYTVRDFTTSEAGIRESLKKVKELGYEAVQMSAWAPIEPALLKDIADENQLEICATHISFDEVMHNTDWQIAAHKTYNCQYVGLGSMPERYRSSKEGFLQFVRDIEPAARRITDAGLTFIYHNHNFEFARFDGVTGMDLLMENTSPDWFQFEMDTYWVQAGGEDVVERIRRLHDRMEVVHFKDMVFDPVSGAAIMAEVGEGNINWQGVIRACGEIGAKWHIVEQDVCQRDPFASLGISLRNLQRMGLR